MHQQSREKPVMTATASFYTVEAQQCRVVQRLMRLCVNGAGTSWVLTPAGLCVWTPEKLTSGVGGRQGPLELLQALLQVSADARPSMFGRCTYCHVLRNYYHYLAAGMPRWHCVHTHIHLSCASNTTHIVCWLTSKLLP